jgi:hypothetical protein
MRMYGDGSMVFQQDETPSHTAKSVQQWCMDIFPGEKNFKDQKLASVSAYMANNFLSPKVSFGFCIYGKIIF